MVATLKMKNDFSNEHSKNILHSSFFILNSSFLFYTIGPEGSAFGFILHVSFSFQILSDLCPLSICVNISV